MADIKEILASTALGIVGSTVEVLLLDLLNKVKENNSSDPQLVVDAVKAGDSFIKLLERAAAKSKTKIDDKVLAMLHTPVKQFAEAEGIVLE